MAFISFCIENLQTFRRGFSNPLLKLLDQSSKGSHSFLTDPRSAKVELNLFQSWHLIMCPQCAKHRVKGFYTQNCFHSKSPLCRWHDLHFTDEETESLRFEEPWQGMVE